jgi:hypothetical protein
MDTVGILGNEHPAVLPAFEQFLWPAQARNFAPSRPISYPSMPAANASNQIS